MNTPLIFEKLLSIPNFQIKLTLECDSKVIPFVKSIIPNEQFTLSKLGSNLRLDLKSQPSNHLLFKGSDTPNPGELLHCVGTSSFRNVFSLDFIDDIDGEIDQILKHKKIHKTY